MIREVVACAAVIYLVINLVEIMRYPFIGPEGAIIGIALCLAAALFWIRDEHTLHRWESTALWTVVLLFLLYGLMKFGGVL